MDAFRNSGLPPYSRWSFCPTQCYPFKLSTQTSTKCLLLSISPCKYLVSDGRGTGDFPFAEEGAEAGRWVCPGSHGELSCCSVWSLTLRVPTEGVGLVQCVKDDAGRPSSVLMLEKYWSLRAGSFKCHINRLYILPTCQWFLFE